MRTRAIIEATLLAGCMALSASASAAPQDRTLELFRVLSRGGRPELWLLGDQIWPTSQPS